MEKHAILSPSAASRWLSCTPSARLEMQFPDRAGEAAEEGSLAHRLGELMIKSKMNWIIKAVFTKQLKLIQAHRLYDDAMLEHADDYSTFVIEQFSKAQAHTKDAQLFLEKRLDVTSWVPEGFGTGDSVIIADGVMDLIDLKYGKGVPVSAVNNKQMMLYGLGALHEYSYMYEVGLIRMTIFQPRIDNTTTWEISADDLKKWADVELKPKAALAFKGEGEYVPGVHCQFCKARARCKAFADMNLELAAHEFKPPALLSDEDISSILDRQLLFDSWLKSITEYALHEAVHNEKHWPGYKVVEGRSNRKYSDQDAVATKLRKAGFTDDIIFKAPELLGITAMEAAITKKVFATELSDLVIKPPGKPALALVADKRPEYNSMAAAAKDFETI